MNTKKLALALRVLAEDVRDSEPQRKLDHDTVELIRVLARVVEGKPIERAFGAPGDWGYGTFIGDALASPK